VRDVPQFSPDQCTFNDVPGMGQWDNSHYREHLQFVQVLAALSPPIEIPNYDFSQMLTAGGAIKSIWTTHAQAHAFLDQITGVTEVDYTEFRYDNEGDFYNFQSYHSVGHAQIRQILGIV
jgi:hypothetical protein